MNAKTAVPLVALAMILPLAHVQGANPLKGYQAKVKVGAATRIDWTFPLGIRSLPAAVPGWLSRDYDSTQQHYELFVPLDYDPKRSYPVVLFISPGTGPAGWREWEAVCKQQGVIFSSPFAAGNNTEPGPKRFRIVLDVLDDVRRNYNTDPDRTYIGGFSGGGRVAGRIAFGLPEYFGGVVSVCATGDFRDEEWLRQRMIDRLSVALVTGEKDFNRGECERYKGPWMLDVGVRSKVWLVPGMGHAIPGGGQFAEVFKWLEEDLPRRVDLAKKYPAMRIAGDAAPSQAEWSKALLGEGKRRLESKDTVYSGLMLLRGIAVRYYGQPAASEASKIVAEYDTKPEKPWDEERRVDQHRFAYGKAVGLTAYATGDLANEVASNRVAMAKEALQLWEKFVREGNYPKGVEEAKKHILELRQIIDAK